MYSKQITNLNDESHNIKEAAQHYLLFTFYHFIITGFILLVFNCALSVGIELLNVARDNESQILEAKRVIAEIKNSALSSFPKNQVDHKAPAFGSIEFWKLVFVTWFPLVLRFPLSLIPTTLFKLPYLGTVLKCVFAICSGGCEMPVPYPLIKDYFSDVDANKQKINWVLEAMKTRDAAHQRLNNLYRGLNDFEQSLNDFDPSEDLNRSLNATKTMRAEEKEEEERFINAMRAQAKEEEERLIYRYPRMEAEAKGVD